MAFILAKLFGIKEGLSKAALILAKKAERFKLRKLAI